MKSSILCEDSNTPFTRQPLPVDDFNVRSLVKWVSFFSLGIFLFLQKGLWTVFHRQITQFINGLVTALDAYDVPDDCNMMSNPYFIELVLAFRDSFFPDLL